jgi:predicted nucleic acid-binding protein
VEAHRHDAGFVAATAIGHDAVVVHNDTDFLTLQRAVPALHQLPISTPST